MVSIEQIKELRKLTGAGIADCKKALTINNNLHDAQLWLQARGIEKIAENANREALEGYILLVADSGLKYVHALEINTETDFLADGELFQEACRKVLINLAQQGSKIVDDIEILVKEHIQDVQVRSKENVCIGRYNFFKLKDGIVGSYLHKRSPYNEQLGKVLGVVLLYAEKPDENIIKLAKHLAMQIVAQPPKYLDRSGVPSKVLSELTDIYTSEILSTTTNKPQHVIDVIVQNKIEKYFEQVVLEEQLFIMDNTKKVKQLLQEASNASGGAVMVKDYYRIEVGK